MCLDNGHKETWQEGQPSKESGPSGTQWVSKLTQHTLHSPTSPSASGDRNGSYKSGQRHGWGEPRRVWELWSRLKESGEASRSREPLRNRWSLCREEEEGFARQMERYMQGLRGSFIPAWVTCQANKQTKQNKTKQNKKQNKNKKTNWNEKTPKTKYTHKGTRMSWFA